MAMSPFWREMAIQAGLWLLFGLQHSGMASRVFKGWWTARLGRYAPWERLIFNLVSLLLVAGVMLHGHLRLPRDPVFQPEGWWLGLVVVLELTGAVVMVWAMSTYDLSRFAGLRAILAARRGEVLPEEPLHVTWLHRRVRHPIYFGVLLVIWCRPWDVRTLVTNLFITLYLWIGVWFEERRLVALYGDAYRVLQRRVPCLIPWPGRTLPAAEPPLFP